MTWPADNLTTDSLDSETDRPSRGLFLTLVRTVKAIVGARGVANGVAPLNEFERVSPRYLPRGVAGGVASLDTSAVVPIQQIPALDAGRIPALDAGQISSGVLSPERLPPIDAVRRVRVTKNVTGSGPVIGDVSIGVSISGDQLEISLQLTRRYDATGGGGGYSQNTQNTQRTQDTQQP